jgi:hypothetical protein
MNKSLAILLAAASAGLAQHGGGRCGFLRGPDDGCIPGAHPERLQWIETLLRWEEMFPPMRGFGFFLAGLDLSLDQSEGITGIVQAAEEEIRELEGETVTVDPRRGFFEAFVSEDFQPIDLELAVDGMDEFRDEALPVVSSAVSAIRELLTEEQLSAASDLVEAIREFGPAPGGGRRAGTACSILSGN